MAQVDESLQQLSNRKHHTGKRSKSKPQSDAAGQSSRSTASLATSQSSTMRISRNLGRGVTNRGQGEASASASGLQNTTDDIQLPATEANLLADSHFKEPAGKARQRSRRRQGNRPAGDAASGAAPADETTELGVTEALPDASSSVVEAANGSTEPPRSRRGRQRGRSHKDQAGPGSSTQQEASTAGSERILSVNGAAGVAEKMEGTSFLAAPPGISKKVGPQKSQSDGWPQTAFDARDRGTVASADASGRQPILPLNASSHHLETIALGQVHGVCPQTLRNCM